jgi:hypothetical protein
LVTCVTPRHGNFLKALFFQPITGLEYYAGVDAHAAPGYFLDLSYLERTLVGAMRTFFGLDAKKSLAFPEKRVSYSLESQTIQVQQSAA